MAAHAILDVSGGTMEATLTKRFHSNHLMMVLLSFLFFHGCSQPVSTDTGPSADADVDGDAEGDADVGVATDAPDSGDADQEFNGDADIDGDGEFDSDADHDQENDAEGSTCDTPIEYPPFREALIPLDGQVFFPVALGGDPRSFDLIVDTGAARTMIDTDTLAEVTGGVGEVTIDFGEGFALESYRVWGQDFSAAANHIGAEIHGVIGQDLFHRYYFGLDYVAPAVTIGAGIPIDPPPRFVAADGVDVPYVLEEGLPVVEVDIGGEMARLIADTGSGVTLVTESYVDASILDDGLEGYLWHTSYGSDRGVIVRIPELVISGTVIANSWAVVVPDEHHLAALFRLLGVDMQGFLGFPVYRRFFVSVLGCENRYVFFPEVGRSHIDPYEWDRVGIEIARDGDETVIDMVFAPSDAADQGIMVGDVLIEIDGVPTSGRSLDQIRLDLRGAITETRVLSIERAGFGMELSVDVNRLLPPLE